MLQALTRWLSSHARQARVNEVFGNLPEACEQYLLAGLHEDAARVLEKLADTATIAPDTRLRHYSQALELVEQRDAENPATARLAEKMVPLMADAPVGSSVYHRRCELLRRLGMSRELGAELERGNDFAGATQVYVEAGLLDEIERASERGHQVREDWRHIEGLFEALDVARSRGDRLEELRALRGLAATPEQSSHLSRARADLAKLEARLCGPRLLFESDALRAGFQVFVGHSLTLGRDASADLHLAGPGISRRHTRLYLYGSAAYVEDLESHNGTWLAGVRLDGYVEILDTTRIRLGDEVELDITLLPCASLSHKVADNQPTSFPRKRESSAAADLQYTESSLDPRFRGDDGVLRQPQVGASRPSLLLTGQALGRPVVLLSGDLNLVVGSGPLDLKHPALDGHRVAVRLAPVEDQMLVVPASGGAAVQLNGNVLTRQQLPYLDEALTVGGVSIRLSRIGDVPVATWDGNV